MFRRNFGCQRRIGGAARRLHFADQETNFDIVHHCDVATPWFPSDEETPDDGVVGSISRIAPYSAAHFPTTVAAARS